MSPSIFHRRRAERFAQLVEEAGGGRRHHVRSRVDAELAELVAIGHQISALPAPGELDPDFRVGLRAMLVATAEREGIGRTARPGTSEVSGARRAHAARPPARRPAGTRTAAAQGRKAKPRGGITPGRIRARGAIIIGVAVGAIAVTGISTASEHAVPGDTLYGVKRQTENAQLALAADDVGRGQRLLDFARQRAVEATYLHDESGTYQGLLREMDDQTISGVRYLTGAAVRGRDPGALDVVDAFLGTQKRIISGMLDKVTGADRDRTLHSLGLMEAISKRVDGLRGSLSCGKSSSSGEDAFGPRPRTCTTGSAPVTPVPAGQQPAGGKAPNTPRTENGGPTGTGTGATAPAVDTGGAGVPTTPTSAPAGDDNGGVLSELGRVFGGLLG